MKIVSKLVLMTLALMTFSAQAETIREIADFEGIRDNQLVGYGLVVGLDGTGDQTQQAPFAGQSLINMLSQLGVSVPPGTNMQVKNVAAVMVTATLPPFSRKGQRLDVNVSSVGNAKSLRGGTLLMTPLKGVDGNIYAVAQGNVLIGGVAVERGDSAVRVNQQVGGRIERAAIVEREVESSAFDRGEMELVLREASFTTLIRVAKSINEAFGAGAASPIDNRALVIKMPRDRTEMIAHLSAIENLTVKPADQAPTVVINSRTGSIVLSGNVKLSKAAVAHGNITVTITTSTEVSQPNALSNGLTAVTQQPNINVQRDDGTLNMVEGSDLKEVVGTLNELGATTDELVSILQALKAAGALNAEIEII